jgi:hypothetical protein
MNVRDLYEGQQGEQQHTDQRSRATRRIAASPFGLAAAPIAPIVLYVLAHREGRDCFFPRIHRFLVCVRTIPFNFPAPPFGITNGISPPTRVCIV